MNWKKDIRQYMSEKDISSTRLAKALDVDVETVYSWIYDDVKPTKSQQKKFQEIRYKRLKNAPRTIPSNYRERMMSFMDRNELGYKEAAAVIRCVPFSVRNAVEGQTKPKFTIWKRFTKVETLSSDACQDIIRQARNPIISEMLDRGLNEQEIGKIIGVANSIVGHIIAGVSRLQKEPLKRAKKWLKDNKDYIPLSNRHRVIPHKDLPKNYNKRIVKFRKGLGINAKPFAKMIGINPEWVWTIETGRRKMTEEEWERYLDIEDRYKSKANNKIPTNVGHKIRKLRKKLRVSAPKLAEVCGWKTAAIIYKTEANHTKPTIKSYNRIMAALDKIAKERPIKGRAHRRTLCKQHQGRK